MKICRWHRNTLGKCAVGIENPHDSTIWTVATKLAPAPITFSTCKVDLADNSFAEELTRPFTDTPDELMPGNAFETHVPFEDLQIRGANAGEMNLDDRLLIFTICWATVSRARDPRFSILDPRSGRR
jgi:hypothetical protein